MANRHRILVLYLLMCCVGVLSNNNKDQSDGQCSLQCSTPKLRQGKVYSKCNISGSLKLNCSFEESSLELLHNVSFLDLSDNNLNGVPRSMFRSFKKLTILSLARNNIKAIEPGTFRELRKLASLNLSFNDLREWRVGPNNELQLLNYLDMTENKHWLPNKQFLLQLNSLTTVQGLTWIKYCTNCSLIKVDASDVDSMTNGSCYVELSSQNGWKWHNHIKYGKALDFIKLGFWPTCLCNDSCLLHENRIPFYQAGIDIIIKASFSLYATGSVALLMNITVVLIIVSKKSLRGNLSVYLVLNIAVCDILISLVSLLYVIYNPPKMLIEFDIDTMKGNNNDGLSKTVSIRKIMGSILTCAVASQVFGSFILTLEKFLKIVFALRPDVRIGKRSGLLFLLLSWSFSVTFAVLPVFKVGGMMYNYFLESTPFPVELLTYSDGEWTSSVGIAAGSQIALMVINLISLLLFIPIFIVAKRSGASVGIKREATIAKKITLLVFTNLVFFTTPVVVGIFQSKLFLINVNNANWQEVTLTEFQWSLLVMSVLPVLCVSINSVLNPFLYALRQPKIKQQLDTILSRCRIVLIECFTNLGQTLRCDSSTDERENDMEMQEMKKPGKENVKLQKFSRRSSCAE